MALTIKQINNQIKKLKARQEALHARARQPAIARLIAQMREYSIEPAEVIAAFNGSSGTTKAKSAKATKKTGKPAAVKYHDLATGSTWTGRGKAPRWITAAEAAGTARERFLVEPEASTPAPIVSAQ